MPFKLQQKGRGERQQLEALAHSQTNFSRKKDSRERFNSVDVIGITVECISLRRKQRISNKEEEVKNIESCWDFLKWRHDYRASKD